MLQVKINSGAPSKIRLVRENVGLKEMG